MTVWMKNHQIIWGPVDIFNGIGLDHLPRGPPILKASNRAHPSIQKCIPSLLRFIGSIASLQAHHQLQHLLFLHLENASKLKIHKQREILGVGAPIDEWIFFGCSVELLNVTLLLLLVWVWGLWWGFRALWKGDVLVWWGLNWLLMVASVFQIVGDNTAWWGGCCWTAGVSRILDVGLYRLLKKYVIVGLSLSCPNFFGGMPWASKQIFLFAPKNCLLFSTFQRNFTFQLNRRFFFGFHL